MPFLFPGRTIKGLRPATFTGLNRNSPQSRGLIWWMPLQIGAAFQDMSLSNAGSGVFQNGGTLSPVPDNGSAIQLAAPNQAVFAPKPLGYKALGDLTVAARVWAFSFASGWINGILNGDGTNGANTAFLLRQYNGAWGFSADGSNTVTSNVNVTTREWHDLVGVRANGVHYLYVDGRQVATNAAGTDLSDSTSGTMAIGMDYISFDRGWDGWITDCRLWNRGLEADEVWQLSDPSTRWDLYAQTVNRTMVVVPPPAVVSSWTFIQLSQGYGSAAATSVSSGPTATTAGNTLVVGVRVSLAVNSVTGVTDTAGNVFTRVNSSDSSSGSDLELWLATGILAHPANVVTAALLSGQYRCIVVLEFSSLRPAQLDVTVKGKGAGAIGGVIVSTAPLSTSLPDTLVVAFAQNDNIGNNWSPGSSYTIPPNGIADAVDRIAVSEYRMFPPLVVGHSPSITVDQLAVGVAWSIVAVALKMEVPPPPNFGTLARQLDPITVQAAGALLIQAQLGRTLDDIVMSSEGKLGPIGEALQFFGDVPPPYGNGFLRMPPYDDLPISKRPRVGLRHWKCDRCGIEYPEDRVVIQKGLIVCFGADTRNCRDEYGYEHYRGKLEVPYEEVPESPETEDWDDV